MHPVVKILCFLFTLVLINALSNLLLWLLCCFIVILAVRLNFSNFSRVIKRTKWLFITILIIYAFTTPGEYIQQFPLSIAPTYEGLKFGFLQVSKLLIAFATLSILFSTSSIEMLMAGLYRLLSPFKLLGFNVERFTARLLLTLDYVEELAGKNKLTPKLGFQQFNAFCEMADVNSSKEIILQLPSFNRFDKLVTMALFLATLALIGYGLFA